ncbi:hypothetical protein [Streptomyces sp. NPDC056549]|uniref:hypothetical protein n=1 Tax=Streptomyces sp. NPDC056549 TaxID=3345864 RepID=UPI003691811B
MDRRAFNPTFTLRYNTEAGEVVKGGLLRSEVQLFEGPKANTMGDEGTAWNIAVLTEDGMDITGRFTCFS